MNTNPKVKVYRQHVKNLETLLEAQHYQVYRKYAKGKLTVNFIRGNEHSWIMFNVEEPNSYYYIYEDSKFATLFVMNVTNKHLGLNLKFDYQNHPSNTQLTSNQPAQTNQSTQDITQPMLKGFLKELIDLGYNCYWEYGYTVVYLHIMKKLEKHVLAFKKQPSHLTLLTADVSSAQVKDIIQKHSNAKIIQSKKEIDKSPKHLYLEIDYHLMELHEYIEENNEELINRVKNKLSYLHQQLQSKQVVN